MKPKIGRPPKPPKKKYIIGSIALPPELDVFARKLGSGNRSKGVQVALAEARERR